MSITSDEYQTPKKYIKAAREVMGSIDLDVACSTINAVRLRQYVVDYINSDIDALKLNWFGNCWLNPPYSKPNLSIFTSKLIQQGLERNFTQLIYLVPSYTSERWYHLCLQEMTAFCLPNHRIHHLIDGKIKDSPGFSSTFFYFGSNQAKFIETFSQFGKCFLNQ